MKPADTKSVPASPTITAGSSKKQRQRSHFSTIINLLVLIALFTFVFALQHIGNKSSDETAPTSATTETVDETAPNTRTPAKKDDKGEKESDAVKTAVVDLPSRPAARSARTFAPDKPVTNKRTRGIGWEDRHKSAALVDKLDGNYRRTTSAQYQPHTPPTYTAPSYQPRTTRTDLDDEIARREYLSANQGVATTPPPRNAQPIAYTTTSERRTYVTQPTTYAAQSRKPNWEVTTDN